MRILWLSPWLRSLSRVHAEALIALGHDVLLVTSDQHPESDAARPYELVLRPHPKTPATWPEFARALPVVRRFGAEVVVAELVRDPRWPAFARGRPHVTLVHDDRPHDASEHRPAWERTLFDRWAAHSAATVTFSRYVADAIRPVVSGPLSVIALTSDLDERLVPAPAGAAERQDFVAFGRLNAYKNLPVTLAAWRRHVEGPGWRGDELVIIGDGTLDEPLPAHTQWRRGRFGYADALPILHRAKASFVNYRQASQSGVQLVSLQLGVTPIATTAGALPEFQPPGEGPLDPDDVTGLAAAIDGLADSDQAARRGAASRAHYEGAYAATFVAAQLADILSEALSHAAR